MNNNVFSPPLISSFFYNHSQLKVLKMFLQLFYLFQNNIY